MIRSLIKTGLLGGLKAEEEGLWPETRWEMATFLHSSLGPSGGGSRTEVSCSVASPEPVLHSGTLVNLHMATSGLLEACPGSPACSRMGLNWQR